jgi:hypothetical protein
LELLFSCFVILRERSNLIPYCYFLFIFLIPISNTDAGL